MQNTNAAMSLNRVGIFRVSCELIRDRWQDLLPVFANFVPIETHTNEYNATLDFKAYSELFDEIELGAEIPYYEIITTRDESNNLKVEARKFEGK